MISGTEIIVYVYMALCACMLFYNLIYIGYSKLDEKQEVKKKKWWKVRIENAVMTNPYIKMTSHGETTKKHGKCLRKKLEHVKELFIFDEVLKEIGKEKPIYLKQYLEEYKEVFTYLAKVYERKDSMKKAYFAYIMSQYKMVELGEKEGLSDSMLHYTSDTSVYCRENALKALYSFGDKAAVVSAYRIMNRNGYIHQGKLVTDGLMTFSGDKKELSAEIWKYFKEFELSYQVAFIDFIKMVSGEFCEIFFPMLQDRRIDDELKFAVIRYYRKYKYEPAKEYLVKCIQFGEGVEWEYAALSAAALVNYPSEDTIRGLKSALSARNWYTRYNAAESLLKLGITYVDVQEIYNGNDRYAREMIKYKMLENSI